MFNKTFALSLLLSWLFISQIFAGEGMWIPMLLQQMNEKEMQEMGLKITAEDIYSINHSSLKDAVLLFGRGCTSELISKSGLLLTNHHCGFGQIQQHSTVEHDYLTDGFWAMNQGEELFNPGLTATLLIRMEEVTEKVLEGVIPQMAEKVRHQLIANNSKKIISELEKDSLYQGSIKPFFNGNQYYMMVTETFKDIRLVGTPPSNIGKFGGDTDNWMWPRHTGDFSLFRIYVGKDGKPAEYAEDNVPYQPKFFLPISLEGVQEDDFTFVFGYPASTTEYLPSYAIEMITQVQNPQKIKLRETRLDIFGKYEEKDPQIRIQYASKDARVANYWKKMIGESDGIKRMKGIDVKQAYETSFQEWAENTNYSGLLPAFKKTYSALSPLNVATDYLMEAGLAIELVVYANGFSKLASLSKNKPIKEDLISQEKEILLGKTKTFFKDYHQPIDREVMAAVLKLYDENLETNYKPAFFNTIHKKFDGDYRAFTNAVFTKSMFDNQSEITAFIENYQPRDLKKLMKDPAYKMALQLMTLYNGEIKQQRLALNNTLDSLQRIYMKAQMEMEPNKRFYPDANFTLRVTYGNVNGFSPKDAVYYKHFTTLEGIIQKENPDVYDYVVEDKLKELYQNKDYGQYADQDGTLHVAFAASNHTTGGNSGSPVLNAEGQLVGVNFDRCWEGTMSDLMYDPEVCRNISMDIRYFLFIVDKYAGAGYLLDEMTLIK
ncbi:MAG: S46 family peptidase [Bacteroidales bacterium]|nr:S46 family peptidase [Bacteroidales bacterium]